MYIAYNQGKRPDVRPCSLLPIRTRLLWVDRDILIEEIYNVDFVGADGTIVDYPCSLEVTLCDELLATYHGDRSKTIGEWHEDRAVHDPMNVTFFSPNGNGSNRILNIPLPGDQIRCEECGNILEWEPRLNEQLRYCPMKPDDFVLRLSVMRRR